MVGFKSNYIFLLVKKKKYFVPDYREITNAVAVPMNNLQLAGRYINGVEVAMEELM